MKIQLIKTKDKYLYKFDGYCYISDHLMNGKEIQKTFNTHIEKYMKKVEIIKTGFKSKEKAHV